MLGAVCHDLGKPATTAFIDGRIRSLDHEEAGVAPATRVARSAERALARRLRRAPARCSGIVAHHLKPGMFQQVADAGQRRRVPAARAEGRPGAARARREVRLPRPRPAASTARRWTGFSIARGRSASSTRRPAPLVMGRHLLALGRDARAADRRAARTGLRAAARWLDHDDRGGNRPRARAHVRITAVMRIQSSPSMLERGDVMVPGSGFEVRVRGSTFRVRGSRFRVRGSGFGVRFRVRCRAAARSAPALRPGRPAQDVRPRTSRSGDSWPTSAALFRSSNRIRTSPAGSTCSRRTCPRGPSASSLVRTSTRRVWAPVTLGLGGEMMVAARGIGRRRRPQRAAPRARRCTPDVVGDAADLVQLRASGGVELHQRRNRPHGVHRRTDGCAPAEAVGAKPTYNYGGGARWFSKKHIAFTSISGSTPSARRN